MKRTISVLMLVGSAFLAGCGDSNDFEYVVVRPGPAPVVQQPPVAVNDVYATDEDTALTVSAAQGVLANDELNDVPADVTVSFPATTAEGGTITLTANTGAFTYTPALGFAGTDSFSYTVTNTFGNDTATVSIEVDAAVLTQGYFVDSVSGSDASGDFTTGSPFATIQAAVAEAPEDADIVVRPGNYTGALALKNGQRLLGSGSALVNGGSGQRPALTGPVDLADGNTVDFLRIAGTQGDAVNGSGQNGGTVTNCEIANTTNTGQNGRGVAVDNGTGDWVISDNTITNIGSIGIDFNLDGTSQLRARIEGNTISSSVLGAIGFLTEDSAQVTARIADNILTGNQLAGSTIEIIVSNSSTFGLDLEDNQNDDAYQFGISNAAAIFQVEQLSVLTDPRPAGAGNTGILDANTAPGASLTEVAEGTLDF